MAGARCLFIIIIFYKKVLPIKKFCPTFWTKVGQNFFIKIKAKRTGFLSFEV